MKMGIVGLGRMGAGIAERLRRDGHEVQGYDRNPAVSDFASVEELVGALPTPRVIWLMVPAGDVTEATIDAVVPLMASGDILIDGGNSNYKDSMRRGAALKQKGVHFLDVGTSGGIWGLEEGFSLMIGGDEGAYKSVEPIFQSLAPSATSGFGRVGASGAGHFVKMIHNGIEYGLMQAYAEGFEVLEAKEEFGLDLAQVAEIWRSGSVVRSWLLDLAALALTDDPHLEKLDSYVDDSGEGRWAVTESIDLGIPTPVITSSLQARFRSRQARPFGGRLLSALRNQFGGHAVRPS